MSHSAHPQLEVQLLPPLLEQASKHTLTLLIFSIPPLLSSYTFYTCLGFVRHLCTFWTRLARGTVGGGTDDMDFCRNARLEGRRGFIIGTIGVRYNKT